MCFSSLHMINYKKPVNFIASVASEICTHVLCFSDGVGRRSKEENEVSLWLHRPH